MVPQTTEPEMPTVEARIATKAKRATPPQSVGARKSKHTEKQSPTQSPAPKAGPDDEKHAARVTKHDRVLTLLSRREGATIPEMMQATEWQQHSVRGFLAGTVKRKLGFSLISSKSEGELRRYRIDTKRGR